MLAQFCFTLSHFPNLDSTTHEAENVLPMSIETFAPSSKLRQNTSTIETLKKGMHALALGSILAVSSMPGSILAEPKEKTAEQKKEEREQLLKKIPTANIEELLTLLDADYFDVRNGAQTRMLKIAADAYEKTSQFPAWVHELTPLQGHAMGVRQQPVRNTNAQGQEFSEEVKRRLEALHHDIESVKNDTWLRGTYCEMPKEKKTVREIFDILEEKIGRRLDFFGPSNDVGKEHVQVHSGLFWDIINSITLENGKRLYIARMEGEGVEFRTEDREKECVTHTGGLRGRLVRKDGRIDIALEPGAHLETWEVVGAVHNDGKEPQSLLRAGERIAGGYACSVSLPEDAKGTLAVTVECKTHCIRRHDIANATGPVSFTAGTKTFTSMGVNKQRDAFERYTVTLQLPEDYPSGFHHMRALAKDAQGKPVRLASRLPSAGQMLFVFDGKDPPKEISYFIEEFVDPMPTAQRTLVFTLD